MISKRLAEAAMALTQTLRDVVVGPGGALYLATNNWDGRGSPAADDDRILRVVPQVPGPMAPALPAGLP